MKNLVIVSCVDSESNSFIRELKDCLSSFDLFVSIISRILSIGRLMPVFRILVSDVRNGLRSIDFFFWSFLEVFLESLGVFYGDISKAKNRSNFFFVNKSFFYEN